MLNKSKMAKVGNAKAKHEKVAKPGPTKANI